MSASVQIRCVLGLSVLAAALLAPGAASRESLAGGQIVFLSDRTPGLGSFGVAVMNGDGSGQHLLTRPEPLAIEPVWLPGGRQIAFESVASPGDREVYGGVWLMRADGAHLKWVVRRFSRWSIDSTWSPGGTRMAFVRNNSLYLARPDGSRQRRVFRGLHTLARPTWSPDGRRLALSTGSFGLGISSLTVLAVGSGRARVLFRTRQTAWDPSWSPDGRKIAFIGETRRNFNLFVMNADGTHSRRLTAGAGITPPSWSPDSTRIVIGRVTTRFGSASDVTVVDVRTARSRTIYRGGSSPQWSPTGRSIAFTAEWPDPTGGIYLIRPDGSQQRLLAPIFGYPHFSPDGTRLAAVAGFKGAVFVVNADGTHFRQLTHPFDDAAAVGSPDHQKIAFVRSVSDPSTPHEPGPRSVYVVNRDGTGLRRIAFGDSVAWAPDSAQVTFAQDGDIYSAPVAGGAARQLTSGSEDDSAPAWSPDGSTIAFTRALAGSARDVCLVDPLHPGAPACLSAGGGAPAWSPDGSMIAFTVGDRSSYDVRIGVIRPDGGERRLIGQGYAPAWAPDSRRLAFVDVSRTQDGSLGLVNVDGTGMKDLNGPPSLPEAPSWSPEGSRLASASCPPQLYDCEIWSVPSDNSPSRRLTVNRVDDIAPIWWR